MGHSVMPLLGLNIVGLATLTTMAAPQRDLMILIPTLALVSFVAAGFGVWAFRRLRLQHNRAELLASDLHQAREEARRRLNFLNAISHDLRTPLNGIMLQTHVLEHAAEGGDRAALKHAAAQIRGASDLAAEILDALLQYARVDLDKNVSGEVRLKELLPAAADPFRAAAEEKALAFSLTFAEDVTVTTDKEKLQRIVSNLLDNAVKFTQHGSISVTVRPAEGTTDPGGDGECTEPRAGPPFVRIDVADTGDGIAPEHTEKVFREFYQANNPGRDARQGLGLGLAVAHRLAHQLGGSLTCASEYRKGSTFTLMLPQRMPEDAAA